MNGFVRHIRQPVKSIQPALPNLDIELTERCNNNCIHCCINRPADDPEARTREMTTAQIQDILNQAAGLGCLEVRLTGGEPLLRPDFEELYLHARRSGMKVLLFTNGCLITKRLADLFARVPPLVEIEITAYGMRAGSYEAVTRTPGSFARFRRGADLLLEREIPFIVKGALLPPNRNEIEEFEAWARTIPWMTGRPNYSMLFDFRNRRDDEEKNRLIGSLRLSPQAGLAVRTRDKKKYRDEMTEFASRFLGPTGDALFACGAGHEICIDAYGRAQPCMGVRAPELTCAVTGTEGRLSLREALDRFSRLQTLHATNPDYLRRCAVCFLKGLCDQCPAKSWAENGTLDTPVPYRCEAAHSEARHLGLLRDGERGWEVPEWRERVAGLKRRQAG
jgi:radical SAM protein with 4Fe4S-binding SPASM domain